MFREEFVTKSFDSMWAGGESAPRGERHREIDRALRRIAAQRCGLDVEEARWLRLAEQENAWRKLGYVHGLEYLEAVFGYRPRTAKERLRVARELGEMPELEEALAAGELNYSVVREVSRVATPATVARWIEDVRGKNLRDVEQLVSGRKKGDKPEDAPDPALVDHDVMLELDAVSHALWRDLRKGLENELGRSLDDRQLIAELHARAFALTGSVDGTDATGGGDASTANCDASAGGEDPVRAAAHPPRHMIHISTCPDCRRAWQDGAGVAMQIDGRALERTQCDAVICDEDRETRAEQTIPERTRRKVMDRDRWRCTAPGCRSARHLEVHHVRHREDGGDNDPSNLTTLCGGHHDLHHERVLVISGSAPDALVFTNTAPPTVAAPSRFADNEMRTLAKMALTQAGFRPAIAKQAVEIACAHVGTDADLTALIKEALRHCGT